MIVIGINAYVTFNGNCRQAVEFYANVFNVEKPEFMTFGQAPPNPDYPLPEEAHDRIMHTRLIINDDVIMFSDTFPGSPYVAGTNVSLVYVSKDEQELRSIFHKLKQGGRISMDIQETFWSKCYGSVKDQFGIEWQVSHEE